MLTIQNYVRAESLQQAWELCQNRRNRILGGMLWLRLGEQSIGTAIDLSGLGLDAIEESDEQFSIGAMVSLRALERHPGFNAYTQGAVAAALGSIIGVQFRNMATVGGSIFGRFGFSDVLTLFLALDTEVELYHAGILPLEQFAALPPQRDVLVRLLVKKRPIAVAYQAMRAARTDFPVLTCAVSRTAGQTRAVLGARPMRAMVLRDEQGLLARGVTPQSAAAFAAWAAGHTPMGSNLRGSAAYRTHLARVLTERALLQLEGDRHAD